MNGFDRPMEELEAAREADEDRMKPSKRDVAAAVKRADYCAYQMSLGYALVENPDMRYLAVLLLEKRRLEFAIQTIRDHSMSFRPLCDRVLTGGSTVDGGSEHG